MPRKPRVFVAGGAYHVYCRTGRGERPFADDDVAALFVETLAGVKAEHGLTILAWCVMPNHYHLVLRSGELPLWRSMRLIQGRFAKLLNRREGVLGSLWQGRYKARLIDDTAYLMRAMVYVHANPITARMVTDPAAYRWSGHRQLVGRTKAGLVDVDEALLVFAVTRHEARRTYLGGLGRSQDDSWIRELPGHLPWWRRACGDDEALQPDPTRPALDWLGSVHQPASPRLDARGLAEVVATVAGTNTGSLAGGRRGAELGRVRELVMLLGVEVCGLRINDLAAVIGRGAGTASRLYGQGAARRRGDPAFATLVARAAAAARELAERESVPQ